MASIGTSIIPAKEQKYMENALTSLRKMADSIVVATPDDCLKAKTGQRDVRAYVKDVHNKLDPFVDSAKRNLQEARDELNRWVHPAEQVDDMLAAKVREFERKEREAAAAEERRINEERRRQAETQAAAQRKLDEEAAAEERKRTEKAIAEAKKAGEIGKREADRLAKEAKAQEDINKQKAKEAAEFAKNNVAEVKVQPNIPKVGGVPSRINYRAEVTDVWRFIQETAKRGLDGDTSLLEFLMIDDSAVGNRAQKMKDSKKFMATYPFTKAWEE